MGKSLRAAARQRGFLRLARWIVAAVALGSAAPAQAGPRDDTLYWSTGKEFDNISPYFDFQPEGDIMSRLVWDTLFYREPNSAAIKPQLATGYKWVGATTLEIELRRDVTFHNGDRFSADDVVETVNRLQSKDFGAGSSRAVEWILSIEKLDSHKIRINMRQPTPQALEFLSGPLAILPRNLWRMAPAGSDGRPDFRRMPPVGSGPYRVTRIEPGVTVELERYRRYFAGPKGRPAIGRVVFTTIAEPAERLRQLMDGRQDWIWQLSKTAAEDLVEKGAPVRLLAAPSMRVAFLLLDRAGRRGAGLPLRDIRVRRAIAHAINRAEIARLTFGSPSGVLHALCYPTQFGCTQEVEAYDYDPGKATELLKAAGFGKAPVSTIEEAVQTLGDAVQQTTQPQPSPQPEQKTLSLNLLSYRNHPVSAAVKSYLAAVGIAVEIDEFSGFPKALTALQKGSADLAHLTWASYGVQDVAEILNPFFRDGALDYCRDSEVQGWLEAASITVDPEERKRAYAKALQRIHALVCAVPLFNYVTIYAFSRDLDFNPSVDDIPRFYSARWKR